MMRRGGVEVEGLLRRRYLLQVIGHKDQDHYSGNGKGQPGTTSGDAGGKHNSPEQTLDELDHQSKGRMSLKKERSSRMENATIYGHTM